MRDIADSMTLFSEALSRPIALRIDEGGTVDAARFARTFADRSVALTGSKGEFLGSATIRQLHGAWWCGETDCAALGDGAILHLPLTSQALRVFFSAQLTAVAAHLQYLDARSGCLLDRFRRVDTPLYEWVILGPSGTQVGAHRDMLGTANWNLLLSGRKLWRFWDTGALPQIDAPALEFEQRANDLIWIPENWWHEVEYRTCAVCLSKNLVLPRSLGAIARAASGLDKRLSPHLNAMLAIQSRLHVDA